MATRIYGVPPGSPMTIGAVVEAVGPTATSAAIALVVDLATTAVSEGSGTRTVSKEEVLLAIETLKNYILADQWPPA